MKIKRRKKIRTRKEFIREIKRLSEIDRKYLNYSYLRDIKRNDLLWESIKHFGGWRKAVENAGFRPIQKGWTKKEITDEIKRAVSRIGYIPRSKEVIKLGYVGLSTAARRRFGNWTNALIAAGFKPHRKNWTEEETIKQLRRVYTDLGHSPSMRNLRELKKYDLLNAGIKFFGTYNNFLKSAGIKIVLDMNKWPREKIISELKEFSENLERTPRRTELAAMGRYDLINAIERHLHSWSEGLREAGFIPNSDVLRDDRTWKDWENLIFKILKKQDIIFHKHKYLKKVGYPDVYIPSEDKIIEIKLNCSDNSAKKDIQKYLPFCNKLEIWYLFGKPFDVLSNKVNFIGPYKIMKEIKNDRELLEEFYKIKNMEVNACERNKKSISAW